MIINYKLKMNKQRLLKNNYKNFKLKYKRKMIKFNLLLYKIKNKSYK